MKNEGTTELQRQALEHLGGLSSEQVEKLVTLPIESTLAGTLGVRSMRSKSLQGLSVITLVFGARLNVFQVRQLVSERVTGLAATLPIGVPPPKLPQLLSVPGVADAIVFGGETRQLQIQLDPAQLMRYGLSIPDVIAATRTSTGVRGAGFVENINQRITVNTDGQLTTPASLAGVVLRWSNGAAVRLGDVGRVTYGSAPAVGATSIMGSPGVMIVLESQYGTNTLTVTSDLERTLAAPKPVLAAQGIDLRPDIFRPANFITEATGHLRTALLIGAALVMAILFQACARRHRARCGPVPPRGVHTAFFARQFIPELREGHYIVHMGLAPGSSLTESMRIGAQISHALMHIDGVRLVAQRAGRADEVVYPVGVQLSEFEVDLKPMSASAQSKTLQRIRGALAGFPGISTSVNTFLVERIDETISGVTAPVIW